MKTTRQYKQMLSNMFWHQIFSLQSNNASHDDENQAIIKTKSNLILYNMKQMKYIFVIREKQKQLLSWMWSWSMFPTHTKWKVFIRFPKMWPYHIQRLFINVWKHPVCWYRRLTLNSRGSRVDWNSFVLLFVLVFP